MCFAVPGKVIEIKGEDAIVDYKVEKRKVKNFIDDLQVGDWVIVSNRIIIKRVPEKEALKAVKLINNTKNGFR